MCPAVEPDWTNVRAPSLAEFEAMATAAYEAMPEPFKALCGEVVMQVVNLPTDDVLQRLGVTSPFDLLGLFEGIGLAQAPLPETGQPPQHHLALSAGHSRLLGRA
jgi:predicted Zn-dependent protease with MMP-like domain